MLAVVTVLLLVAPLALVSVNSSLTSPFAASTWTERSPATAQDDGNGGGENYVSFASLHVYPSAIENKTTVVYSENFEGFPLGEVSNITKDCGWASLRLSIHSMKEGLNASAPSYLSTFLANPIRGPIPGHPDHIKGPPDVYYYSFFYQFSQMLVNMISPHFNTSSGIIIVGHPSDSNWCNETARGIFENVSAGARDAGILLEIVDSDVLTFTDAKGGTQVLSYVIFTAFNDSETIIDVMSQQWEEGPPDKVLQAKEKYLMISSEWHGKWESSGEMGAVIEGGVKRYGDLYTVSLRDIIGAPSDAQNLEFEYETYVVFHLPMNVKEISYTPPERQSWLYPYLLVINATEPASDYAVTYTVSAGNPLIVVDYDMTNWNMTAGETENITLTVRNVGDATAYNVCLYLESQNDTAVYFTDGPPDEKYHFNTTIGNMNAGSSVTVEVNVTANNTGMSHILVVSAYASSDKDNATPYLSAVYFPCWVEAGDVPLLVITANFSDWILDAGQEFTVRYTVRNVGDYDASNVTVSPTPFGPVTSCNVTLGSYDEPLKLMLGDIAAHGSVTAEVNMTLETIVAERGTPVTPAVILFTGDGKITDPNPQGEGLGPISRILQSAYCPPMPRPSTSLFLEVERWPKAFTVPAGGEVLIGVKVRNRGTTTVNVSVLDMFPGEAFTLVEGDYEANLTLASGSSTAIVYVVKAKRDVSIRLPVATVSVSYYRYPYTSVILIGAPVEPPSGMSVELPAGNNTVDASTEAGVSINIQTSKPVKVTIEGLEENPGGPPPEGFQIIGRVISIEVDDPSAVELVVVFIKYNQTYLDEHGIDEHSLKVSFWNETSQQWEFLDTAIDAENDVAIGYSGHLTYFAIIGSVRQPSYLPLVLLAYLYTSQSQTGILMIGGAIALVVAAGGATVWIRRRRSQQV